MPRTPQEREQCALPARTRAGSPSRGHPGAVHISHASLLPHLSLSCPVIACPSQAASTGRAAAAGSRIRGTGQPDGTWDRRRRWRSRPPPPHGDSRRPVQRPQRNPGPEGTRPPPSHGQRELRPPRPGEPGGGQRRADDADRCRRPHRAVPSAAASSRAAKSSASSAVKPPQPDSSSASRISVHGQSSGRT